MHTKHEIVCTGLPDAMLIKNAALTKTRMAPSRTALQGIRPVQVLSNLSRRADSLNGAIPILSPKSGQSLGRRPIHKLKFVYTGRIYILYRSTLEFENGEERSSRSAGHGSPISFAKSLAKKKQREADESDEDKEDNQEEEDEASPGPSNSEVEKSATQNQKIAELRRQLQEE